jgi:hypothetical protein
MSPDTRAEFPAVRLGAPDLLPPRSRKNVRPRRRRHISRIARAAANLLGAADAGPRGLSRPDHGALSVRVGRPSRRWRDRCAWPQRRSRNPTRFQAEARRPPAIAERASKSLYRLTPRPFQIVFQTIAKPTPQRPAALTPPPGNCRLSAFKHAAYDHWFRISVRAIARSFQIGPFN